MQAHFFLYTLSLAQVHSLLQKHRLHGSFTCVPSPGMLYLLNLGADHWLCFKIQHRLTSTQCPVVRTISLPCVHAPPTWLCHRPLRTLYLVLVSLPSGELLQGRSPVPHLYVPRAYQSTYAEYPITICY